MPKLTKKFVVFNKDSEIFKYIPEDDDHFVYTNKTAMLFETLQEAKMYAIKNLTEKFEEDLTEIKSLKYKDFK